MTTRRRREDDESQSKRRREANKAICQPQPPTIMPVFSHLQGACCKSTRWMVHRQTKTKQMAVMTSFYQHKVWNCSRANLLISDKTFQTPSHVVTPLNRNTSWPFSHATTSTESHLTHIITNYSSSTYSTKPQPTNKKMIQNLSNKIWFTSTTEQKQHKHLQLIRLSYHKST